MSDHLTEKQLRQFELGLLDAAETKRIRNHLYDCDLCDGRRRQMQQSSQTDFLTVPDPNAVDTGSTNEELPREFGPYILERQIDRGGMGVVYQARHRIMDREQAVKIVPLDPLDAQIIQRFHNESKAGAGMDDPRIVKVLNADVVGSQAFLAMDLIHGADLDKLVGTKPPLSVADASKIVFEAAQGLHAAHKKGFVHCDVKPKNIMLGVDGKIKILDFGLAEIRQQHRESQSHSATIIRMGTPEYASPEQCNPKDAHGYTSRLDHKTDIYSLGCTFYFLLTRRAPFSKTDGLGKGEIIAAQLSRMPEPLAAFRSDVPASVQRLISQMLMKNPEDRPDDMEQVTKQLKPHIDGASLEDLAEDLPDAITKVLDRQTPLPKRGVYRWRRRLRRALPWIGVAALLALAIAPWFRPSVVVNVPQVISTTSDSPETKVVTTTPNLFTSSGPHNGFNESDFPPRIESELRFEYRPIPPEPKRYVHHYEAMAGPMTIRYLKDDAGVLESQTVEIGVAGQELSDPWIQYLIYPKVSHKLDIHLGTHRRAFYPTPASKSDETRELEQEERYEFMIRQNREVCVLYCYPDLTFQDANVDRMVAHPLSEIRLQLKVVNRGTFQSKRGKVAICLHPWIGYPGQGVVQSVSYSALQPGESRLIDEVVLVPSRIKIPQWYLSFWIDVENTTKHEFDELPVVNWKDREDNYFISQHDDQSRPKPNNVGHFLIKVQTDETEK